MFGNFFDTSAVDAFARAVVGELSRSLPPERVADASKKAAQRRDQLDAGIRRHAADLVAANRLNVYQKAKLGTCLQDRLEAAGYPDSFARPFAFDVVKLVALASSQPR